MDTNPFQLHQNAATEDVGFRLERDVFGDNSSSPIGSDNFEVGVSRGLDDILNQLNTKASDGTGGDVDALLHENPAQGTLDDLGDLPGSAGDDSLSVFDIGPLKGLLSMMEGVNDGLEKEGFDPQSVQRLVDQFKSFAPSAQLF